MTIPLPASSPSAEQRASSAFRQRVVAHTWHVYLALGLLICGTFFLLPSPAVQNVVGTSVTFGAALALALGVRIHRPLHAYAWSFMAAGLLMAVSGDTVGVIYENVLRVTTPFPSIADVFYLGSYLVFMFGLLQLTRARMHERDWGTLIDALIVAVGAGMVSWVFLMEPYVRAPSLSLVEKLVSIAYPLVDILTLAVAVRLLFTASVRSSAYLFLSLGITCWLVADTAYGILTLQGTYHTGSVVQVGWMCGYTCIALAGLHPAMREVSKSGSFQRSKLTMRRLVLLAGAALLAPAALVLQNLLEQTIDVPVIAGGAVVLFVLVIARMSGLMRALARSLRHVELLNTRERSLRKSGVALVAATDRSGLYNAAVEGTWALTNNDPITCATLALGTPDTMTVVAAAGTHPHVKPGEQIAPHFFQGLLQDALQQKRTLRADGLDANQLSRSVSVRSSLRSVCITPLLVQGDVRGMILLVSDGDLPPDCQYALEALGIDVALALESMALAEAVHQQQSDARLAALVQHASDVLLVLDPGGTMRYVSPSVTRIFGYSPGELTDGIRPDIVHPDDLARIQRNIETIAATAGATCTLEMRVRHNEGHWMYLETIATNLLDTPFVNGILLTCRDITERKGFEAWLTHQAFHDTLTNLPNRALFADRLQHASARAARQQRNVAVLFFDLDRFKTINDSLGHEAGDQLLLAVTKRLQACVRPEDTLARFGGDEFTILVEDITAVRDATSVAERLLAALNDAFCVHGHEVFVSASIGIMVSNNEYTAPADLLRYADIAMYQAKNAGKARYVVFNRTMNAAAVERLELEHDLRRAIERHDIQVYYQPIIDLTTEQVIGLEALARWHHAQRGFIPPTQFIPLAEETGLIVPLGRWVLEQACRQVRRWQEQYGYANALEISVNLSARQFRQPLLVDDIAQILDDTQLPPASLKLEITESVVMEAADTTAMKLHELKALGVQLAIDDFGTGYSSLSYLKRFPVDTLKIDRAFITGLGLDAEDTAIVHAVTRLAQTLGLSVTAEGVETADIVAQLRRLGCEYAQGYFWAKPLPSDEVAALLAAGVVMADAPPIVSA